MLAFVILALGIIMLVVGVIASATKNVGMMKLLVKQKKDEDDEVYLDRSKKSFVIMGVALLVLGGVWFFI